MHTFRKYISNRGSALFMVISTMTALMITCMAMYFTVLSSRSAIYATFNQKQSYQSAVSIYEMILNDAQAKDSALREKLLDMEEYDEIVAHGEDELLGEYTVTIIRLPNQDEDGVTCNVFDIVVTTKVNGVSETVHSQTIFQPPSSIESVVSNPNVAISPTFAATGYVPNDVYLDRGRFRSDVYFDNEITYFGAYDNGQLFIHRDINCSGSVVIKQGKSWKTQDDKLAKRSFPTVFAVRNTLTVEGGGDEINAEVSGDKIYVGGNMYLYKVIKNYDIYVNGDLHLYAENQNTNFYVNGNVYLHTNSNPSNAPYGIWCNGEIISDNGNGSNLKKGTWAQAIETAKNNPSMREVMKYDDFINDLDMRTQTTPYYKWIIDKDDVPIKNAEITINQSAQVVNIEHGSAEWSTGCILKNINVQIGGGFFFIIVDTGDDPDNVYTIQVQANRTYNGEKKYFSWSGEKGDSVRPIVLVKGRGSVVIDVPAGVIYQDVDDGVLCHYNWWILSGMDVSSNGNNGTQHLTDQGGNNLSQYVHTKCGHGCTEGCVFEEVNKYICEECKDTTYDKNEVQKCTASKEGGNCKWEVEKCERVLETAGGGEKICGKQKVTVRCKTHTKTTPKVAGEAKDAHWDEYITEVSYCPNCETYMVKDNYGYYNICQDTVNKSAVSSKASSFANLERDSHNNIIYPTCNVFLISCEESADVRYGHRPDGSVISKNTMIGYLYAPYVTFFAAGGDQGADALKYMGGMTVSDYNFFSEAVLIICKPDKNPTDLMNPASRGSIFRVSKDWKISLKTH